MDANEQWAKLVDERIEAAKRQHLASMEENHHGYIRLAKAELDNLAAELKQALTAKPVSPADVVDILAQGGIVYAQDITKWPGYPHSGYPDGKERTRFRVEVDGCTPFLDARVETKPCRLIVILDPRPQKKE